MAVRKERTLTCRMDGCIKDGGRVTLTRPRGAKASSSAASDAVVGWSQGCGRFIWFIWFIWSAVSDGAGAQTKHPPQSWSGLFLTWLFVSLQPKVNGQKSKISSNEQISARLGLVSLLRMNRWIRLKAPRTNVNMVALTRHLKWAHTPWRYQRGLTLNDFAF